MENQKNKTVEEKKKELDVEKVLMVIGDVIHKRSLDLMKVLIEFDNMFDLSEIITINIEKSLMNEAGILTRNLEISPEQRDKLRCSMNSIVQDSKMQYQLGIKDGERNKDVVTGLSAQLKGFLDYAFGTVSAEINRGLLVPCDVVKVDAKKPGSNTMELAYSKDHNVSVPCNALVISSDTIDVLKEAMALKDEEFDFETGEFIERSQLA